MLPLRRVPVHLLVSIEELLLQKLLLLSLMAADPGAGDCANCWPVTGLVDDCWWMVGFESCQPVDGCVWSMMSDRDGRQLGVRPRRHLCRTLGPDSRPPRRRWVVVPYTIDPGWGTELFDYVGELAVGLSWLVVPVSQKGEI
jgi:hypothetical protein